MNDDLYLETLEVKYLSEGLDDEEMEWIFKQAKRKQSLEKWSKKQTERVQELEEVTETDGSAFHSLEKLFMESEQQNKRYREAIEKIKKKISKQLEGLDAEEEMQRVMELSELMTMAVGSLKGENFNLSHSTEQLDLFGEESE